MPAVSLSLVLNVGSNDTQMVTDLSCLSLLHGNIFGI